MRTPIDIESILEYGKDKWFEEFDWPISWQEFLDIEDSCKKVLNNHIDKYPEYADIILINYKVFIEYSNLIYALFVLKNSKYEPMISKENTYFHRLFHNGVPDKPLINFPSLTSKKHIIFLKKVKFFFTWNNIRTLFKKKYKKIFLESYNRLGLKFLTEKGYNVKAISFFDFYDKHDRDIGEEEKNRLNDIISSIIDGIINIGDDYQIQISDVQREFLHNTTFNLFSESFKVLKQVEKRMKHEKIELYIGANNNCFSRIMSVAIRRNGGKIYGFTHGEPMIYNWDKISWMELSLNDYYYEYTDLLKTELKKTTKEYPPLNNNECKIKSMELSGFDKMFNKNEHVINKENKKVMLIGNFFREQSYSAVTAIFAPLQLFTELSIIMDLKNDGYEVIYKIHPEHPDLSKVIMAFPDNVEIESERFEKVIDSVDAFVFYYTGTSTFGPALLSKKRVIYMNKNISNITELLLTKLGEKITIKWEGNC